MTTRPNPNDFKSQLPTPLMWQFLSMYPDAACDECGARHKEIKDGIKRTLTKDHIVEISDGGKDEISNIRFLCRYCHDQRHGFGISRVVRSQL
jgi:hypothetical protein